MNHGLNLALLQFFDVVIWYFLDREQSPFCFFIWFIYSCFMRLEKGTLLLKSNRVSISSVFCFHRYEFGWAIMTYWILLHLGVVLGFDSIGIYNCGRWAQRSRSNFNRHWHRWVGKPRLRSFPRSARLYVYLFLTLPYKDTDPSRDINSNPRL